MAWYRTIQQVVIQVVGSSCRIRATGRQHVPPSGGVLMIANHLSYFDVFVIGLLLHRPLNYVARSTLFKPVLGWFIRSVGGFPIQRDGMGAQGLKETLRRLRQGSIVTMFPEGTRSRTGAMGPLRPGITTLAERARVPIVPVGLAGTFEAWPRGQLLPRPHAVRVHFGPAIAPEALEGLSSEQITALLTERLAACVASAQQGLAGDLLPDFAD